MKGYFHSVIGTADLKMDDRDLTPRSGTLVDGAAVRAPARQRHKFWRAPTPWPVVHKNGSGFFLRHHYGKAILSYSPLAVEATYTELAMAAHLALLLELACGGSQGPLASKVGERRRQVLLKLLGYFNCCERWRNSMVMAR
jgi:hypothetical protein